jgi:hypothetical protein
MTQKTVRTLKLREGYPVFEIVVPVIRLFLRRENEGLDLLDEAFDVWS